MWNRIVLLTLLVAGTSGSSCRRNIEKTEAPPSHYGAVNEPHSGDSYHNDLADALSTFACNMYGHLKEEKGNLCFSPYSLAIALSMTYAGAGGETKQQIADLLNFQPEQDKWHLAFAEQIQSLNQYQRLGEVQLYQANSLWPQESEPLLATYTKLLRDHYGIEVFPVNYHNNPEAARLRINQWSSDQTQGRITEAVQPGLIHRETVLVLTNAVYFKGSWNTPFFTKATKPTPFYTSPKHTVTVDMMYQKLRLRYAEFEALQILEIPYDGKDLSMLVLLPKQMHGYKALEAFLTQKNLKTWRQSLERHMIEVFLPRFKMTVDYRLDDILKTMGMTDAFDPAKADFSGITGHSDGLALDFVVQKTWIQVNEQGTEAAATSAIGGGRGRMPDPPVFRADHPFLFLTQDNTTGTILFLGRILNPTPSR